jgi:hypothetical protein
VKIFDLKVFLFVIIKLMIKKSQSKTGSAHVIIVIIIITSVIAILGFVIWKNFINKDSAPTNSENKTLAVAPVEADDTYREWKLYESNRDKYSIKYPPNWFLAAETEGDGPYIRNFDPNDSSIGPRDGQYSGYRPGTKYIRVLVDTNENDKKNASNMTTTNWYDALGKVDIQYMGPLRHLANEVKKLTVNGLEAKSAKAVFTETNEVIYLLNGNVLYSIWLYPYGSSDDEEIKVILNSFKYL